MHLAPIVQETDMQDGKNRKGKLGAERALDQNPNSAILYRFVILFSPFSHKFGSGAPAIPNENGFHF